MGIKPVHGHFEGRLSSINTFRNRIDESLIVIGCNYHTTWQSHRAMRFVLAEISGNRARLKTRETGKDFWTDISDLIFIQTPHNIKKAFYKLREVELKRKIEELRI